MPIPFLTGGHTITLANHSNLPPSAAFGAKAELFSPRRLAHLQMSDTDPTCKLFETSVLLLNGKQLSGTKIIASLFQQCLDLKTEIRVVWAVYWKPPSFSSLASSFAPSSQCHHTERRSQGCTGCLRRNSRVDMQEFSSGRAPTSTHSKKKSGQKGEKAPSDRSQTERLCVWPRAIFSFSCH